MYTPKHLEWLDRTEKDRFGWPVFVTEEAKEWCKTMLLRGFAKYGPTMGLDMVHRCIFDDYVRQKGEHRPECLKLGLWDAIYGVCYRALMEVGATDVWTLKS